MHMQLNELGDHCFVLATESMSQLVKAFHDEAGRKPSIAELCEILTWGARTCSVDLVVDGANRGITIQGAVSARMKRVALKAGDLVSVPYGVGARAMLVYLGKFGSFGHSFGICRGTAPLRVLTKDWEPDGVHEYPVFLGLEFLETGRWTILGNRPDLGAKFHSPEIYHHPEYDPGDGSYGPNGLGESPSGRIRRLDKTEAAAIFHRFEGGYHSSLLADQFERYLVVLAKKP